MLFFKKFDPEEFVELWKEVDKQKVLPNTAIMHIPDFLTDKTKKKLLKRTPADAAKIVKAAVDEVDYNHSVERLDVLVQRKLKEMKRK